MADGWGGARQGAGRKPKPVAEHRRRLRARRLRAKLSKLERSEDAREYARAWLRDHEEGVLDRILASDDLRLQFEILRELRRYAFGAPPQSIAVTVSEGPSPAEILRQIWEERQRRLTVTVRQLPEGERPPDA